MSEKCEFCNEAMASPWDLLEHKLKKHPDKIEIKEKK